MPSGWHLRSEWRWRTGFGKAWTTRNRRPFLTRSGRPPGAMKSLGALRKQIRAKYEGSLGRKSSSALGFTKMTLRPIEFRPAALADAEQARAWYATQSPEAPARIVAELVPAIHRIHREPSRWPPSLPRTRHYRLLTFPFLVINRHPRAR